MPKQYTFKERLEAGLKAQGWIKDNTDRGSKAAYKHPAFDGKMFVGDNGSLRYGRCVTQSSAVGDATRQREIYSRILKAGETALDNQGIVSMD